MRPQRDVSIEKQGKGNKKNQSSVMVDNYNFDYSLFGKDQKERKDKV